MKKKINRVMREKVIGEVDYPTERFRGLGWGPGICTVNWKVSG